MNKTVKIDSKRLKKTQKDSKMSKNEFYYIIRHRSQKIRDKSPKHFLKFPLKLRVKLIHYA